MWVNFPAHDQEKTIFSMAMPNVGARQVVPLFVFTFLLLLSNMGYVSTQTNCPWDQEGLLLWSDANTWGDAGIPIDNGQVKTMLVYLLDKLLCLRLSLLATEVSATAARKNHHNHNQQH